MTDPRRPLHLAVMIGASTAVYAASVAAVAVFQSNDDLALRERQAPAVDVVARLHDGHDRLQGSVDLAAETYDRAAARYDALTTALVDTETSLTGLAKRVQSVSGATRALPGAIRVPPISRSVAGITTSRPKTSASTGASGH